MSGAVQKIPLPGGLSVRVFGETLSSLGMASRSAYTLQLQVRLEPNSEPGKGGGTGSDLSKPALRPTVPHEGPEPLVTSYDR